MWFTTRVLFAPYLKAANSKGTSITVPLTDWFGLVCFANKNKKFQLSYS
jgi:hypothetical protein